MYTQINTTNRIKMKASSAFPFNMLADESQRKIYYFIWHSCWPPFSSPLAVAVASSNAIYYKSGTRHILSEYLMWCELCPVRVCLCVTGRHAVALNEKGLQPLGRFLASFQSKTRHTLMACFDAWGDDVDAGMAKGSLSFCFDDSQKDSLDRWTMYLWVSHSPHVCNGHRLCRIRVLFLIATYRL